MSEFRPAFRYLMESEDPHYQCKVITDNNGAKTISGINAKSFPDDEAKIEAMPEATRNGAVATFYFRNFWIPYFSQIRSQRVASKLLDTCANNGLVEGVRLLQGALNHYTLPALRTDGNFGPQTLAAVNATPEDVMLKSFVAEMKAHYEKVAEANPETARLAQWLERAAKLPEVEELILDPEITG